MIVGMKQQDIVVIVRNISVKNVHYIFLMMTFALFARMNYAGLNLSGNMR